LLIRRREYTASETVSYNEGTSSSTSIARG
jgi:hypothetical protein